MATKKKSKKPTKKLKKPPAKKVKAVKKLVSKKAAAKAQKAAMKAKSSLKKPAVRTPALMGKKKVRRKSKSGDNLAFTPAGTGARSGGQSGGLQGLSDVASADSESVDELVEEGNAFEAEVIEGVEDASEPGEVHAHEVPEDDVPEEYEDQ